MAHGLSVPCEACEVEETRGVVCRACDQPFPEGLARIEARRCHSLERFHAEGKIAFEQDALAAAATRAIEERAKQRLEAQRSADAERIARERLEREAQERGRRKEGDRIEPERLRSELEVREPARRAETERTERELHRRAFNPRVLLWLALPMFALACIVGFLARENLAESLRHVTTSDSTQAGHRDDKATAEPETHVPPGSFEPAVGPFKPTSEASRRPALRALEQIVTAVYSQSDLSLAAVPGELPEVDAGVAAIDRIPKPPRGSRQMARKLLDEGLALLGQPGKTAAAADVLLHAHQADPLDVQIVNDLGYAELKAGRFSSAEAHLIRALELAPSRTSAWVNLAQLTLEYRSEDPKSIDDAVRLFLVGYWFSGNRQKTIQFLRAQSTSSFSNKGTITATRRALEIILERTRVSAMLDEAERAIWRKDFDEAQQWLDAVRHVDPGNEQLRVLTAQLPDVRIG